MDYNIQRLSNEAEIHQSNKQNQKNENDEKSNHQPAQNARYVNHVIDSTMIFFLLLLFFCFYFFACLRLHHGFKLRGKCAKNSQTEIEIVETAEEEKNNKENNNSIFL